MNGKTAHPDGLAKKTNPKKTLRQKAHKQNPIVKIMAAILNQ